MEALFRRAIGVPQGTFTAIFLETPTERKKAFDKLLKVEEYRQGAEKLKETANFIKNKLVETGNKIAFSEGKLADYERIENDFKKFQRTGKRIKQNARSNRKRSCGKIGIGQTI